MLASSRAFGSLLAISPKLHKCLGRNVSSWKIVASALIERPPTIVKQFNSLERVYLDVLQDQEREGSLLCDHELRAKEEEAAKGKGKKQGAAVIRVKLAEDLVNDYKAELTEFRKQYMGKAEPNLKLDDVNRLLDESLSLLVLHTIGGKKHWLFPRADNVEGESLRQTAERAVLEYFGDAVKVKGLGNAPVAFYKYKFPEAVRKETGHEGAKVFFMRMHYQSGALKLNAKLGSEMIWASHDEMVERLPDAVRKAVVPAFFRQTKPDFTRLLDLVIEKEEFRKRRLIAE